MNPHKHIDKIIVTKEVHVLVLPARKRQKIKQQSIDVVQFVDKLRTT